LIFLLPHPPCLPEGWDWNQPLWLLLSLSSITARVVTLGGWATSQLCALPASELELRLSACPMAAAEWLEKLDSSALWRKATDPGLPARHSPQVLVGEATTMTF
jgi:hypothetical protein